MKSLHEMCEPRKCVFDPQKRDTVLDLTDLVDERIDPNEFFIENYITEGMKTLLEHGFRRLEGKTDQGGRAGLHGTWATKTSAFRRWQTQRN